MGQTLSETNFHRTKCRNRKISHNQQSDGYHGLVLKLVSADDSNNLETVNQRFLTNSGDAVIPKPLYLDALRKELASLQVGERAAAVSYAGTSPAPCPT
jgi:hypothetical protein